MPFESVSPFTFDFGSGNSFQMRYGRLDFGAPSSGFATPSPGSQTGLSDVVFLATFNYVPGSGTGAYEEVIDGEIFMTAIIDDADLTTLDIPYTWSSDVGFLTFIPEPTSMTLVALAFPALTVRRRKSRKRT